MSTYLKSDNTYDNEVKEFFDYEQQRLKLFTDKMNLYNNKLYKPQIKVINPNCKNCIINGKYTCRMASIHGHLECLKYAHENGCNWSNSVCSDAACYGHLECLKYAHKNGCLWDRWVCHFAALNGHLDCLKYAHENECSWDKNICYYAAINGQFECLKYAHENGCPWDYKIYIPGIRDIKCRNYLHKYIPN